MRRSSLPPRAETARSRAFALFLTLAAFLAGSLAAGAGRAGAQPRPSPSPRVHVRGSSRLDARASRVQGRLAISGTLVDDAARPVPNEKVTLTISPKSDPAQKLALPSASPSLCSDARDAAGSPTPILERADTLTLKTDAGGRFCVRLALAIDRYFAHLAYDGGGGAGGGGGGSGGNIDATRLDLPIDLALQPLALRFDPEPRVVSLDAPASEATLDAVASIEEDGATSPAVDVMLTLSNEAGTILGSAQTSSQGRARFTLARAAALGPPGRGELRLGFAGNAEISASTHVAEIERRTHVDLAVLDAKDGRLAPGSPEDGVTMSVVATPRNSPERGSGGGAPGGNGAGAPPGGSVEARYGDTVIGAAPFEAGRAHLVVTFAGPATANDVSIHLRYVSETPWLEAGNDTIVTLPLKEPSLWRRAPLVVAGLAVVAWLALGRTSRVRAPRDARAKRKTGAAGVPAMGEARVDVVRAAPAHSGWTGWVADAHDGFAVGGARVEIVRAAFDRVDTLVRVETNAEGGFALPPVQTVDGDRLVVEARFHAPLEQAVPPSGELLIALVLRKRALLDRLVSWARRRGKPFDGAPEPTPGHVRRAAGAEFAIARWADAVERAAYGGVEIDERAEAEVERLAPVVRPVPAASLENAGPAARRAGDAKAAAQDHAAAQAPLAGQATAQPLAGDMTVKDERLPDEGGEG